MTARRTLAALISLFSLFAAAPALAWNCAGHKTIARLAMEGFPSTSPDWLRDPNTIARVCEQACEPDRWRGTRRQVIAHELNPEHYLDLEDLEPFGLTLNTIPPLRHEYFRAMVLAKHNHPDRMAPYDSAKDPDKSKEWPGFLPHAIDEHFALLQSSFNTVRTLEALGDPARAAALEQAKANAIYHMGVLAHYVGDAAQPLHTTRHHHGWVGPNPEGFTTDNGFHAYIDGTIVEHHKLDADALRPAMAYDRTVDAKRPWQAHLAHIQRSFDAVVPLYSLQRDRLLTGPQGRNLIAARLRDGSAQLSAYYNVAWEAANPSESDLANFRKFNPVDPTPRPKP
ncbi:MAG: hypothetical protein ACKVW3_15060 [Phycisphaerales bacterium]